MRSRTKENWNMMPGSGRTDYKIQTQDLLYFKCASGEGFVIEKASLECRKLKRNKLRIMFPIRTKII